MVAPIYKTETHGNITLYTTVSLPRSRSRILKLYTRHRTRRLKTRFSSSERGFSPCRSTTCNLVAFISSASKALYHRDELDKIYFDSTKLFHMGDYKLLLTNPLNYGVCRTFHLRQQSLLRGRNCFESSSFIDLSRSSGVHQIYLMSPRFILCCGYCLICWQTSLLL